MKFPLSLLKRFLISEAPLATIAEKLTAIGLEVETIEDKSESLKPFVVAEILEAEKHPQADKLRVCKVKAAQGMLQIVCGAPNARAGIKVALANVGAVIPTNGMEIKKSAIRGVESQGMLCSARELGLGDDHAGIIELAGDATIGTSIVDVLGLNDPVIDINVTANRGDCLGVVGIARDLAAAGLGTFKPPCIPAVVATGACPISITIADTDGCYAFSGRVIRGVKNTTSPQWLQHTLTAAGMRPISALVDITNYFTLAFGRPAHVYDLKKLNGGLRVRVAEPSETIHALNEKTYTLSSQDCVIADDSGAIGIGGIMGGTSTAVDADTTDILLELALFNPIRIAKTGRALQIDSDARQRFERGVDFGFLEIADARATELILELCGGNASQPVIVGNIPTASAPVMFDATAINALGGTMIPETRQKEILQALGFTFNGTHVTVPRWRHDITQPADLAEEVLRIVGYDAIPTVALPKPTNVARPALNPAQKRISTIRRTLAARGLHETYGWGFISEKQAALFGGQTPALRLLNPISEELSVMRPSLLPHLVDALQRNRARGMAHIALFEIGAVFRDCTARGQHTVAAGVYCGEALHWNHKHCADIFTAKADALVALGIDERSVQISRTAPAWYHPGKSGAIMLGPKTTLAYFGELHPLVTKQLGIEIPVVAFEVFVDALPAAKPLKRKALIVSDFQPVQRDFAFVIDKTTAAAELVLAVNKSEKELLRDVTIFDVYEGKGVPEGKRSIALSITLQAPDRTLTDVEIEKVSQNVIASAMKVGATLR